MVSLRERAAAAVADAEERQRAARARRLAGEDERQREWARRVVRERLRLHVPDAALHRLDAYCLWITTAEGDTFRLYPNTGRLVLAARYDGCTHWWESATVTSDLTLGYAFRQRDIEAGGACHRCRHSS